MFRERKSCIYSKAFLSQKISIKRIRANFIRAPFIWAMVLDAYKML